MRYPPLLTLVVAAILIIAGADARATPPAGIDPPLALGAAEIGLSPEAVIVSGLYASSTGILQNLTSSESLCVTLVEQRNTLSAAVATTSQLEAAVGAEPDNPTLQQQYEAALVVLQAATTAVANTRDALLSQVMTGVLEADQQQYQIFQQSAGRRVPAAFRVKVRSDNEWREIELALIAEARAAFVGQPFEGEPAQLLASIRGEIEVIAAQAAVDDNLTAMQAAFDAALGSSGA